LDSRLDAGEGVAAELPALAAYFSMIEDHASSTYLLTLMNVSGVIPAIADRAGEMFGDDLRHRLLEGVREPTVGGPLEENPEAVRTLISNLERDLPPSTCQLLLTGNFHRIPAKAFLAKQERFAAAADLDAFLAGERELLLSQLEECLRDGLPWHEIRICEELLELVGADGSMGSGMRQGDVIVHTKVPFDAGALAREEDPAMRRYHVCHCPLVRTSIREGDPVPALFCQCSAGFTALPYEVIFGERVEIEVLETALAGSERCRFAITIPERFR
jgi:hypothetical protein